MNRWMTKQKFDDFIFKHAPQRAKGYSPLEFLQWYTVFGQDIDTATKVWRAWENMDLTQRAYLSAAEELDRKRSS